MEHRDNITVPRSHLGTIAQCGVLYKGRDEVLPTAPDTPDCMKQTQMAAANWYVHVEFYTEYASSLLS